MKYNNYAADKLSKLDERAVTTWTNNLPTFNNTTDSRTVDRGLTPGAYAGGGKFYRTTTGFNGERPS